MTKIPEGWIETTLKQCVNTNEKSITKNYLYEKILYLDTGSITENKIEGLQEFLVNKAPSRAKRLVKDGDIIYSTVRPNQKHFGFIKNPQKNLVVSTGFAVLSPKENSDGKFIYYYITQDYITEKLHIIAEQAVSTYPSIKPENIENFLILLPPLPEQKAIAGVLSSFDDKIELLGAENQTLEEMGQTLFKEWFGKYKVGDELPDGWKVGKIEDLTEQMASGGTPSTKESSYYNGEINWFSTKEFQDNFLFKSEKQITESGLQNSSAKLYPENTVLMAIYAAPTVGRLGILTEASAFNQAAVGLIAKKGIGMPYIYLLLQYYRNEFNNLANGAAQQNLSVGLVKNFQVIIPNQEYLSKFNLVAEPIFNKIRLNSEEINNLSKTRDQLLPKLMSGEVRVEL